VTKKGLYRGEGEKKERERGRNKEREKERAKRIKNHFGAYHITIPVVHPEYVKEPSSEEKSINPREK